MPDCEKLTKCPFFTDKMAQMPATAGMMKRSYCLGNKEECARYQVASRGIAVPLSLYPNQVSEVPTILAAAGR